MIVEFLRDPSVDNINVDSEDRIVAHGKMLQRKKMLQEVFTEFHHIFRFLDDSLFTAKGLRIEIGAGVSPIRNTYSDVIASDLVYSSYIDRVLDAENLDLPDATVRTIYAQNCFHHIPHPDFFFQELCRVLAPGGGAILIEPYYGPFATFMFKRIFHTERFDKYSPYWETSHSGPMNGANQALSYIVFERDKTKFQNKYPNLQIVHRAIVTNYLKYLISGGLNFKQLLPDITTHFIDLMQRLLTPFNGWFALHHIVVIKKI